MATTGHGQSSKQQKHCSATWNVNRPALEILVIILPLSLSLSPQLPPAKQCGGRARANNEQDRQRSNECSSLTPKPLRRSRCSRLDTAQRTINPAGTVYAEGGHKKLRGRVSATLTRWWKKEKGGRRGSQHVAKTHLLTERTPKLYRLRQWSSWRSLHPEVSSVAVQAACLYKTIRLLCHVPPLRSVSPEI